jgi:hypothetical protein
MVATGPGLIIKEKILANVFESWIRIPGPEWIARNIKKIYSNRKFVNFRINSK